MEIVTVKNSEGAVLEKKVVTTISVEVVNGSITVQGNHVITRMDGVEVPVNGTSGFNIQPVGSSFPGNPELTEDQVDQIMIAKDAFLAEIKTILDTKSQTT